MPRSYPAGLLTSSNLCVAVLIQRADGTCYGLSDSTVAFEYNGRAYQSVQGADASSIHQEAGTTLDNLKVSTILNDALNYVTTTDIIGTRFENSIWTLFLIDYTNPANGAMILARYRMAKVEMTDTKLTIELMGLLSLLKQVTGRVYTAMCDVLVFGDKRCDPGQTVRAALSFSLTVGAVQNRYTVDFFGDSNNSYYYNFGDAIWSNGFNSGLKTLIKIHTKIVPAAYAGGTTYGLGDYATSGGATYYSMQAGNTGHTPASSPTWWQVVTGNPASVARMVFREPYTAYPVEVGDIAVCCFGCDRRKATCASVPNANEPQSGNVNIANFHGFYMPDPEEILSVGRP